MRSIVAFLLGVAVTIGGAYVHDNVSASTAKPFVNWDAVKESTQSGYDFARAQIEKWTK